MPTTLVGQDRPTLDASGGRWGIATGFLGAVFDYAYFVARVTQDGSDGQ